MMYIFSHGPEALVAPLALLLRAAPAALLRRGVSHGVQAYEVYEEAPHVRRQGAQRLG